jgi:PucR family transcriptional regulator, purine catabolism regulatory protein
MPVVDTTNDISLSEFLRLALPMGTQRPEVLGREQLVKWVVMAGAGVMPTAGDFVLCGSAPTRKDLSAWAAQGVVAVAVPAGAATNLPAGLEMPVLVLPEGAVLRDIQRAALELIVNRQSYLMERGALVAQTLTARALEGAGLEGLARAMAALTGKTIVVQDKRLKPLAQAVAPAMSHVWTDVIDALSSFSQLPEGLRDRRQAAALAGLRDQSLPGGLMRLVCPIVAQGMARGYLSVIGSAGDLDALDQLVVEYGAAACALEMAKAKAVSDAEKRAHGDFIDAVLTGSLPTDELVRWAQRIGTVVDTPHAALVWRWGGAVGAVNAPSGVNAPSVRRLETIVNQSVVQQAATALVRPRGAEVVVFCGVGAIDRPDAAVELAQAIRKAAAVEYPQLEVFGGIGRPAGELPDWKDSYREASQALGMAARLHEQKPLYFGDLSVYRLLFQLEGNPELEAFCREALGPLLEYEGGGDLLETLEAFCERLGNLSQTAEKLFIHRNSLLYRMERISQIAGLDMSNPDTRLAVHLALKIRKMLYPVPYKRGKLA